MSAMYLDLFAIYIQLLYHLTKDGSSFIEGKILKTTKDGINIRFDQVIDKHQGHFLCGVKIMRRNNPENFGFFAENHQRMSVDYAHQLLGHPSLVKTIATAKNLGWMVDTAD